MKTIALEPEQRASLRPLAALLLKWNGAHNLVSRTLDPDAVLDLLWEATAFSAFLPRNAMVADLGSGAGIPALPLAVVRPDIQLTAVEPRAKRCTWLRFAAGELGLSIQVKQDRWDPKAKEFDRVVSRAVFQPPEFMASVGALAAKSLQMTGNLAEADPRQTFEVQAHGRRVGLILAGHEANVCEEFGP